MTDQNFVDELSDAVEQAQEVTQIEDAAEPAEVGTAESALADEVQGKIEPEPEKGSKRGRKVEKEKVKEPSEAKAAPFDIFEYLLNTPIPYSMLRRLRYVDAQGALFYLDDYTGGDVFILRPCS
jgi:hypothetical protein